MPPKNCDDFRDIGVQAIIHMLAGKDIYDQSSAGGFCQNEISNFIIEKVLDI